MPLSLDELGERGLNTGWRVQLQVERREYHCFVLSRELSGRLLGPGQAAPGDDDLVPALFGEQAGCRIAEPGSGTGDERDRMFQRVSPVFICLAALHTREYDTNRRNARSFVLHGNYYCEAPPRTSKRLYPRRTPRPCPCDLFRP